MRSSLTLKKIPLVDKVGIFLLFPFKLSQTKKLSRKVVMEKSRDGHKKNMCKDLVNLIEMTVRS